MFIFLVCKKRPAIKGNQAFPSLLLHQAVDFPSVIPKPKVFAKELKAQEQLTVQTRSVSAPRRRECELLLGTLRSSRRGFPFPTSSFFSLSRFHCWELQGDKMKNLAYCQGAFDKRENNRLLEICERALKSDNVLYRTAQ